MLRFHLHHVEKFAAHFGAKAPAGKKRFIRHVGRHELLRPGARWRQQQRVIDGRALTTTLGCF